MNKFHPRGNHLTIFKLNRPRSHSRRIHFLMFFSLTYNEAYFFLKLPQELGCFDTVGKCLGTAVTAVRPIIGICIPMMSKKEGFYLQEMHA